MSYLTIVLIVVAVCFLATPLIMRGIQNHDYKKQLEGKIPERQFGESGHRAHESMLSDSDRSQMHGSDSMSDKAKVDTAFTSIGNAVGPH